MSHDSTTNQPFWQCDAGHISTQLGEPAVRTGPFASKFAEHGMVCAVDHLAAQAGVQMLQRGGTAADAAIATNAVLAVTTQHMCGLGGDLFALVDAPGEPRPYALNASGRSGSGADLERLRRDGHTTA